MLNKWIRNLCEGEMSLREIMFRMILTMGIFAAIIESCISLQSGEEPLIVGMLAFGAASLVFSIWLIHKFHKMELAAIIVEIIFNFLLFPISFFKGGGINSGATVWFVLGIVYVFLLFREWKFYIFLAITMVNFISVYYLGLHHPEWIVETEEISMIYIGSSSSVFVVSLVIGILIKLHIMVYEEEQRISEKHREDLERISLSKDKFFANMSHEIRTPINTIIGLNEMTLREEISDEIAENSINIQNASKILLTLINDILDISKIESGKMEIVPVQYETGAMFSDLVNLMWIRTHQKKLDFKIDISEEIPSMLYGDEVRIKQILSNLLTNAVKYTKEGSIKLTAKSRRVGSNGVKLRISVTDTGIGIRKEDMANVFSDFKRVDEGVNVGVEGTGLGLAISKQLIEMMGGKITVDSIYTKGSNFTVEFEQKIVDESPIGAMNFVLHKKMHDRQKYKQRFEAPEAKILIVDDNAMNLMVACKLLRGTKVQIDTASSGQECIEKARHKMYNVIFMDHIMPEMDGVKTLELLRKESYGLCQNVPVIALTANAMAGAEEIYARHGFQGYLAKPINGPLFEAMLLRHLPPELIMFEEDDVELEEDHKLQVISGKRKKPIIVTTDCVCDLPTEWLDRFGIKVMYCYVHTSKGRFCDVKEVSADNLLEYIEKEDEQVYTSPASVESYEVFFGDALDEAETVIHISLAKFASKSYENASMAAKGFDNVTVINSGHLSSGMGLVVMYAAKMAQDGYTAEEISKKLKVVRRNISTSFLAPSTSHLYRNKRISKQFAKICEMFSLHPILSLKHSKMVCRGIETGRLETSYKRYIRKEMRKSKQMNEDIMFITYCGCSVKQLERIKSEVQKYKEFKYIVFQKASATISSNCGFGTFGLIYIKKED